MYKGLDPRTFLDLAEDLARSADESARRTAADRAYYAAFLYSRDQLAAKGYMTPYYTAGDPSVRRRAAEGRLRFCYRERRTEAARSPECGDL